MNLLTNIILELPKKQPSEIPMAEYKKQVYIKNI